jgi:hypothetical protein
VMENLESTFRPFSFGFRNGRRNPLSFDAGHAGHRLRVSHGNSDVNACRADMPDGANRSGG